jgi:hypothetical protein
VHHHYEFGPETPSPFGAGDHLSRWCSWLDGSLPGEEPLRALAEFDEAGIEARSIDDPRDPSTQTDRP